MRVPPHDLRAEESLLGAMLLSPDAIGDAVDVLGQEGADRFYKPAHGHLYTAILDLYEAQAPVDAVTVSDELKRVGLLAEIGGPAVLLDFQARTPAISNAGRYARIVDGHASIRRVIATTREISEALYDGTTDAAATIEAADQRWITAVHSGKRANTNRSATVAELMPAFWEDYERRVQNRLNGNTINGLPCGIAPLDERLDGFHPGNLIVIGGRPVMGKTILSMNIAEGIVLLSQRPGTYFTLEVPLAELHRRLVVSQTMGPGVAESKVKRGDPLTAAEMTSLRRAADQVSATPLTLEFSPRITIGEIRSRLRRHASKHGPPSVVVVDHVGLAGTRHLGNRTVELSEFVIDLKTMAIDFDTTVIAVAQLNRSLESRNNKRPMLSDLRETGELEQSADIVILAYREVMYDPFCDRPLVAELNTAKHRDGEGDLPPLEVACLTHLMRFMDLGDADRVTDAEGSSLVRLAAARARAEIDADEAAEELAASTSAPICDPADPDFWND
jgi:replicative DNA helicase